MLCPSIFRFLNQTRLFVGPFSRPKSQFLALSCTTRLCTKPVASARWMRWSSWSSWLPKAGSPLVMDFHHSWFNLRPIQVLVVFHRDLRKPPLVTDCKRWGLVSVVQVSNMLSSAYAWQEDAEWANSYVRIFSGGG